MKLGHLPLACQVHLGHAELQVDDYHQLRVGDMIVLDRHVNDTLDLSVEGVTLFKVTAGLDGMRKAVCIQEVKNRIFLRQEHHD